MAAQYIYLARHGETDSNLHGISQGVESELNSTGHNQAKLLARRAQSITFSRLLCSSFKRAQQTAAYIAREKAITVEVLDLLREVANPTDVVGQDRDGMVYQSYFLAKMKSFEMGDASFRYSDEESFAEVVTRVTAVLQHFETLDERTFVVTHGHFLRYLVAYVLTKGTLDPKIWATVGFSMTTSNTGITVLFREDRTKEWRLHSFNDIAHFADN